MALKEMLEADTSIRSEAASKMLELASAGKLVISEGVTGCSGGNPYCCQVGATKVCVPDARTCDEIGGRPC